MKNFLFIIFFWVLIGTGCATSQRVIDNTSPKNIIFLIGDGMGLSQVSASIYFNDSTSNFERFSTIGLIKNSAFSHLITDSAASTTAYATGVKTYNGAIGVSADTTSVEIIFETLSNQNISTGLIATSSIVHATPASFYAHVSSRQLYDDIATFLPTSQIDFIAGGGRIYFQNRKDNRDLLNELSENGYEVNTRELPTVLSTNKQAILLADDGMKTMLEGRGDFLPNATSLALKHLSNNNNGFILVVEGSQIDWGGHDNNADYLISEQLDFDKTVGVALDFAEQNDETLVIVTADHETGGFTLSADGSDYNKIKPKFATKSHSATLIPVFAKGPGEHNFGGMYDNTSIYDKIMFFFKD